MMNREHEHPGQLPLRAAFPAMPDECRAALSQAARSVREAKRPAYKLPAALLAAALLLMTATIALAEGLGWNVLAFLGIGPDSGASTLVQPVSARAEAGSVAISISSAITDGDYLAFDWTVENTTPELPVFLQVDSYTVNGQRLWTDSNDSFNCRWLPNWFSDGLMQGGELTELPDTLTGEPLHVEMVIGVYTPQKPVYYLNIDSIVNEVDAELVRRKWAEGCYVLESSGEGFIIDDPEDGPQWVWSGVNEKTGAGLVRSEMVIRFDLEVKDAAYVPELPEPVSQRGVTLALTSTAVTPLQTHLYAAVRCESGSRETILHWAHRDEFVLTDRSGSELDLHSLCTRLVSEVSVQQASDGSWYRLWDLTLIDLNSAMPEEVILTYRLDSEARLDDGTPLPDGLQLNLPMFFK